MTFSATAGRILVTDASGVEKLDTNDGLFHVIGSPINGTTSFPNVALSEGAKINDGPTNFTLGSCHAACTHVIGAVRFSGSAAGAVGFDRWTSYMGGTLVWVFNSSPKLANGNYGENPSDYVAFHFTASGGAVRMVRRRIFLGGPDDNIAGLRAFSIAYRLKAGLFT
jgi:hypothetical protein